MWRQNERGGPLLDRPFMLGSGSAVTECIRKPAPAKARVERGGVAAPPAGAMRVVG